MRNLPLLLAPLVAGILTIGVYWTRLVRELPVAVVDLDQSAQSRAIARDIDATPQIKAIAYPGMNAAETALRRGDVQGVVAFPEGLDEDIREGRTGQVTLLRDAGKPLLSTQVWQAVNGALVPRQTALIAAQLMRSGMPPSAARELALPFRPDSRPLDNPYYDYMRYLAPGLLPSFVQMCLMLAGGWLAARRKDREPLRGKKLFQAALPWLLVQSAVLVVIQLYSAWIAGAPWQYPVQSIALSVLLATASLMAGMAAGLLLAEPYRTTQILLGFNSPAFLAAGYTYPNWAFPPLLDAISRPLPYSLYLDGAYTLAGGPSGHTLRGWLGLLAWVAVAAVVIWRKGRSRSPVPSGTDSISARKAAMAMLLLVAPPLYLVLYGSIYADKEELRLPVAVTLSTNSELQRTLFRDLSLHPRLSPIAMAPEGASVALQRGDVRALIVIPSDLDQRKAQGLSSSVTVLMRNERFLPAGDIARAVGEVLLAHRPAPPLLLDDRPVGNPESTYGDYMIPVIGLLILHQILMIAAAFSFATSKKRQPLVWVRRGSGLAIWIFAWALLWLTLGQRILQVPIPGITASLDTALTLATACALALVAATGLGLMIGALIRNGEQVLLLLAFTSYPFFFLSGYTWPMNSFPLFLHGVAQLVPVTPLLHATDRATRFAAEWSDLSGDIIHLAVLAAIYWLGWLLLLRVHKPLPVSTAPSQPQDQGKQQKDPDQHAPAHQ